DGLPLAIELAAARTRLLQPSEIADRLARSAIALGGGSRDLHARQQTIRGTIEWSYQLLSPQEQELMSKLATFAGPIRVDAIDVVLGTGDGATADVLADLVDKSLLQQRVDATGTTRVRMLELIREFADERLADRTDVDELAARHAAYYAEFAEEAERSMLRDMPDHGMRRIEADFADIARAFDWSIAHDPPLAVAIYASLTFYFHSTGLTHTARKWEELTRAVPVDSHLAARRSIGAGYVAFGFRLLGEARKHWQQALPGLREAGDLLNEAWATMSLGATHIGDPDNHDEAVHMIERGIALAEQSGAPVLVGLGFNIVGELSRTHGDDDTADAAYLASTQVARTIGDHYREAVTTGNRVYIASHRGEYELAISQGKAALDIHRRHGHHNQVPWVSLALCGALVGLGRVEEACLLMGAADEAARRMLLEELPGDVRENAAIRRLVQQSAGSSFTEWYEKGRAMPLDEAVGLFTDD
ncbi:MAG TPA: hypothetical protein VLB67_00045, partial [Acidimicrobiia bacterium]|nr:hypothetical protein [Acidimicrobiia bacterium]